MFNPAKIVIGVAVVAILVYAVLAFDLPYKKVNENPKNDVSDLIHIFTLADYAEIESPITITGEARGTWFFEASFPIQVLAPNGTLLGQGHAEAQGDWMTEEFVPWSATLTFDAKGNSSGIVRFMNDNPSGLPENDKKLDVPVSIKVVKLPTATSTVSTKACIPTGCGGQLCSDQVMISTCVFRPEHACYRNAECKRQADGLCGWTETPTLAACLSNPPSNL
jgi:hypothetical protein